jgi:pimeloyl-ACP methyl ester carboxylesterase
MSRPAGYLDSLLKRLPRARLVDWIEPLAGEAILDFAQRLARTISPDHKADILCGVSFGGIVAQELAPLMGAKRCMLISSIRSTDELPPGLKRAGRVLSPAPELLLRLVGDSARCCPAAIRPSALKRLAKLGGRDGHWHRWATGAVLTWTPSEAARSFPTIAIHGSDDETFPIQYVHADVTIVGAGHDMASVHANEVAAAILDACNRLQ